MKGGIRGDRVIFTIVTSAMVLILALLEWLIEKFIADRSRAAGTTLGVCIVLIAALVFNPIHKRVEAAVESILYKKKREALAAVAKFRRELSSFNDLTQLLRRVVEAVERYMDASACAIYLRREVFRAEASTFDIAAGDVELDDPLAVRLRSSAEPARPHQLNSSAHGTHAFAMTSAGDLIGFLNVHRKRGDYDAQEMHMLGGLAQDLASALITLEPQLRVQTVERPNNIPAGLPEVIGRERELAEIRAALAQSRLVTVTGSGGVGKTRIALQCAGEAIARHEHGAWFVNLAPIRDGKLIPATMLAALDAGSEGEGDVARLIEHLRSRDALVVIDNCEQIVADVAAVVSQVRAKCPRVSILTTSRELLRLDGEIVYRLGPLSSDASVELFARRAAAVTPGFDARAQTHVVRNLCEHLDGVPLAIELAAARTRALSVEETLVHLNERFKLLKQVSRTADPRQQTLAATIEWSYDLLTDEEKSMFRRVSVFRGSFTLGAAAAACASDGRCDEYHILDVLTSLADKSLVVTQIASTTRCHLLETIREFAAQKSAQHEETAEVALQHAQYFAEIAAQAYHEFDSRIPAGWLSRLAPDVDNFRAALEWSLDGKGDLHLGARMAADCGPVFLRLGLLAEVVRWCDTARNIRDLPPSTAGRVEYVASMVYTNLGDNTTALACAENALEAYQKGSSERDMVRALSQVAQLYARNGRFSDAEKPASEAIRRARALGEPRVLTSVLRRVGYSLPPAQIAAAREYFAEAFDVAEAARDDEESCRALAWWAYREAGSGKFERAIELGTKALERASHDLRLTIESQITCWSLASGRFDQAESHARAATKQALEGHHPLRALVMGYAAAFVANVDPRHAAMLLGYAKARLAELHFDVLGADDRAALERTGEHIVAKLSTGGLGTLESLGADWSEAEAIAALDPWLNNLVESRPSYAGQRS